MTTLLRNQAKLRLGRCDLASHPLLTVARPFGIGLWLAIVIAAGPSLAYGWQSTDGPRLRPSTAPRTPPPEPAEQRPAEQRAVDREGGIGSLEPTQPPKLLDTPLSEMNRDRDTDSIAASFAQPLTPSTRESGATMPARSTAAPPIRSLGSMTVVRQPQSAPGRDVMVSRPSMSNWIPTASTQGSHDFEADQRPRLPLRDRSESDPPSLITQPPSGLRSTPLTPPVDESDYAPRLPLNGSSAVTTDTSTIGYPMGTHVGWPNGLDSSVRTANYTQQPPLQPSVLPNNNFGQALPNQGIQPPTYQNQPYAGSVVPSPQGGVIPSPMNPTNLPRYQPRVVTQEPFVTAPPCRFDAYDMVSPANYQQCVPGGVMPIGGVPGGAPYTYTPPTVTPNMAPGLYAPNNSGWRPLFTLGQENYNAQLGRGLFGQPTAYVSGQPVRNFFRYVFP